MPTPWGDAETLRERRLKPGPSQTKAETKRNQRERLFAALVATVAERGYEATSVAHIVELSGVARSSFYEHFKGKQECFLAALDALVGPPLEQLATEADGITEARTRCAFDTLIGSIATQPAAAKVFLVDAYAAGPAAAAMLARVFRALAEALAEARKARFGRPDLSPEIVWALVGGVRKVVCARVLRGEEAQLLALVPGLWEWMLSVPPPPGSLSLGRRGLRPRPFEERQRGVQATERVLRAMAAEFAERGYGEVTVAEVAERAQTSQRTFYESFADKESAMVAAIDSGSAQMLSAALPAFRNATDRPGAVRLTLEALFRFAAEVPEYGRLWTVEVYAAGSRALEERERTIAIVEDLLGAGCAPAPGGSSLAMEAIGGGVCALLYDAVEGRGPERLLELVPAATYLTLSPFLGAEVAYATAADWDRR